MKTEFEKWWEAYITSDECKLKKTQWSYYEVGIIKEAMEDAFSQHNPLLNKKRMYGNLRKKIDYTCCSVIF